LIWRENFRCLLGGPSMPDYAVKYWQGVMAKMVKTCTWQAIVTDIVNRLGMGKKK